MEILTRNLNLEETKKSYKNVVWFYDAWSWLTESKAAKQVLKYAEIKDNENILEVACGTGVVFEKIVNLNPNGKNIGVDVSPDMLKKAKKRLQNAKSSHFDLKEGDVFNLEVRDGSFDLIVNNFMVDLMPVESFDKIAGEFYRVLKPNGRVVISTFSFGKKSVNKFWWWVAKNMPGVLTGCRPVSFKENLIKAGFTIEQRIEISQNTFPAEVIKATKNNL